MIDETFNGGGGGGGKREGEDAMLFLGARFSFSTGIESTLPAGGVNLFQFFFDICSFSTFQPPPLPSSSPPSPRQLWIIEDLDLGHAALISPLNRLILMIGPFITARWPENSWKRIPVEVKDSSENTRQEAPKHPKRPFRILRVPENWHILGFLYDIWDSFRIIKDIHRIGFFLFWWFPPFNPFEQSPTFFFEILWNPDQKSKSAMDLKAAPCPAKIFPDSFIFIFHSREDRREFIDR